MSGPPSCIRQIGPASCPSVPRCRVAAGQRPPKKAMTSIYRCRSLWSALSARPRTVAWTRLYSFLGGLLLTTRPGFPSPPRPFVPRLTSNRFFDSLDRHSYSCHPDARDDGQRAALCMTAWQHGVTRRSRYRRDVSRKRSHCSFRTKRLSGSIGGWWTDRGLSAWCHNVRSGMRFGEHRNKGGRR